VWFESYPCTALCNNIKLVVIKDFRSAFTRVLFIFGQHSWIERQITIAREVELTMNKLYPEAATRKNIFNLYLTKWFSGNTFYLSTWKLKLQFQIANTCDKYFLRKLIFDSPTLLESTSPILIDFTLCLYLFQVLEFTTCLLKCKLYPLNI